MLVSNVEGKHALLRSIRNHQRLENVAGHRVDHGGATTRRRPVREWHNQRATRPLGGRGVIDGCKIHHFSVEKAPTGDALAWRQVDADAPRPRRATAHDSNARRTAARMLRQVQCLLRWGFPVGLGVVKRALIGPHRLVVAVVVALGQQRERKDFDRELGPALLFGRPLAWR